MSVRTAFALPTAVPVERPAPLHSTHGTCRATPARAPRAAATATATRAAAAPAAPTKERVLERAPSVEREAKQPGMYRLYIYNDPINKRERVVDVLLKTCQGLSFSRAYAAMQEAHENGRGLVLIVAQEIAEHYCSCINSAGVLSTVEPDS